LGLALAAQVGQAPPGLAGFARAAGLPEGVRAPESFARAIARWYELRK
jgi:hypothetical protein